VIQFRHVTKSFGAVGVRDVSFICPPGTVTGFLGPNGAGKSTSLRVLCGLIRPDSGSATIDGVAYAQLPQPGRRVGVMLDATAMHPGRTGRETLILAAQVLDVGDARVAQVLDVVGLDRAAIGRHAGTYSLGMRQRLALGLALLGDPGVLVLDEPANGLDPQGIRWMRTLLREYADRGGTVLLSSHLLPEVEAIADHLVVIDQGTIVADATPQELQGAGGTSVRALDPSALTAALVASGYQPTEAGNGLVRVQATTEQVGRVAAAASVVLTELRPIGHDLEQVFFELTGHGASA